MQHTLTRTSKPDLAFDGSKLSSLVSAGKPRDMSDSRHSRWFEWDLYKTDSGKYVTHVRYRAGELLPRELPRDVAVVGADSDALLDQLSKLPWQEWITGWPRDGRFDDRNVSLMRRLTDEWAQMLIRAADCAKSQSAEVLE